MKLKLNKLGRIANPNSEYAIRREKDIGTHFIDENRQDLHSDYLTKGQADKWQETFCKKVESYEDVINSYSYLNKGEYLERKVLLSSKVKQRIYQALKNEIIYEYAYCCPVIVDSPL